MEREWGGPPYSEISYEGTETPFSDVRGIDKILANIPDPSPDPSELVGSFGLHSLLKDQVEEVLHGLTPRERWVLQLRFGLVDGRSRTLVETGQEIGRSERTVRRIEKSGLQKLKYPSRRKSLRDYLPNSPEPTV